MFFKTFLNVSIIKKVTTISKVCVCLCVNEWKIIISTCQHSCTYLQLNGTRRESKNSPSSRKFFLMFILITPWLQSLEIASSLWVLCSVTAVGICSRCSLYYYHSNFYKGREHNFRVLKCKMYTMNLSLFISPKHTKLIF